MAPGGVSDFLRPRFQAERGERREAEAGAGVLAVRAGRGSCSRRAGCCGRSGTAGVSAPDAAGDEADPKRATRQVRADVSALTLAARREIRRDAVLRLGMPFCTALLKAQAASRRAVFAAWGSSAA